MFKIYKLYLKWKLSSLIKDKLLHYSKEKADYVERRRKWMDTVYEGKCYSEEEFERRRKEQIEFSADKWVENHHRYEAVKDILLMVEKL